MKPLSRAFVVIVAVGCSSQPPPADSIIVVMAHPDDEIYLGGVLAREAQRADVRLVIATDGRYGVTSHAGIPAGDSLAAVRAEEARCSARALGIPPPMLLGFHNGLRIPDGVGQYFLHVAQLKEALRALIETSRPEAVITFGPDGDTGHADHRLIGAIVTELLLQYPPHTRPALYYFSWPMARVEEFEGVDFAGVHEAYLDTTIRYSEADEARSFEALRCYRSQYTPEEISALVQADAQNPDNVRYFHRWVGSLPTSSEFLRASPSR